MAKRHLYSGNPNGPMPANDGRFISKKEALAMGGGSAIARLMVGAGMGIHGYERLSLGCRDSLNGLDTQSMQRSDTIIDTASSILEAQQNINAQQIAEEMPALPAPAPAPIQQFTPAPVAAPAQPTYFNNNKSQYMPEEDIDINALIGKKPAQAPRPQVMPSSRMEEMREVLKPVVKRLDALLKIDGLIFQQLEMLNKNLGSLRMVSPTPAPRPAAQVMPPRPAVQAPVATDYSPEEAPTEEELAASQDFYRPEDDPDLFPPTEEPAEGATEEEETVTAEE